jgi:hypothetical protein
MRAAQPTALIPYLLSKCATNSLGLRFRTLFERLMQHDHIHNLAWVWEAAAPGFGPGANGAFSQFFPGLLYVDALDLAVDHAFLFSRIRL